MKTCYALALGICCGFLATTACVQPSPPSAPTTAKELPPANAETLAGTWQMADLENYDSTIEASSNADKLTAEIMNSALETNLLKIGWLINFFSDGTYTQLRGHDYEHGRWQLNADRSTISFTQDDGTAVRERAFTIDADGLMHYAFWDEAGSLTLVLQKTGEPLANQSSDPFHPANNQWRLPAKQQETQDEIRGRLKNHLQHNLALLDAATERQSRMVSWQFTPTCVQIYNGGIGIKDRARIDDDFYTCFHARKEAEKGIELFEKVLQKRLSPGASTGSWITDDANLLRLLLAEL